MGLAIALALLSGFVVGVVYGILIAERHFGRLWVQGKVRECCQ